MGRPSSPTLRERVIDAARSSVRRSAPILPRRRRRIAGAVAVAAGASLLTAIYLLTYLHDSARPGHDPQYPLGWNGWFDQGNYFKSALSLAYGELDPDRHWYPLGYSLAAALFARAMPVNCFLVPDLLCLLACFGGFVTFCSASGVGRRVSVPIFLMATMGSASLRHVWSQPWNTTLSAALLWWLLALTARLTRPAVGPQRSALGMAGAGALCACIVETRPTDALLVGIWLVWIVVVQLQSRRSLQRTAAAWLSGAAIMLVPYGWLYLSIYGAHPTPYMRMSAGIGFSLTTIWWKAYLLLIDPQPWYPSGAGLLERLPWLFPGLAGIVAVPFLRAERRSILMLLSVLMLATWTLFFTYTDLLPSGLWLFENVHYFKWTFPGLLLVGFVVLRNLRSRQWPTIVAACVVVLLATSIRLMPKPARASEPAWMIQVPQAAPGLFSTYIGSMRLQAGAETLVNTRDFRALPDAQGFRIVTLYRPLIGSLSLDSRVDGIASGPVEAAERWRIEAELGPPCWLPPYACNSKRALRRAPERSTHP